MKLCPICATSYPADHRTCPTHGAVLIDTPELTPGTMIRDCYRIERTLGKGGMGTVYLAEHTLMGEQRALEFLAAVLASNQSFVQRFLQEARAANKLHHPSLYGKACDGGDLNGCDNLGVMYQKTEGVEQDLNKAATLYSKACDGGASLGCSHLGYLYRAGNWEQRDPVKAHAFLTKGCSMGNQWGCDRLQEMERERQSTVIEF